MSGRRPKKIIVYKANVKCFVVVCARNEPFEVEKNVQSEECTIRLTYSTECSLISALLLF
jgi:hypothetical protein